MYDALPTKVETKVGTLTIRNKGDFRVVIDCFLVFDDPELSEDERAITALIIFYEDFNDIEDVYAYGDLDTALKEMMLFFNCGQENPPGANVNKKVIDWEKDSLMIVSAINNVAKKEIRELDTLHWWTFMSYYYAIGECALSTIVGIRYKIVTGKKLEKHEQKFKQENPGYFIWNSKSVEDKQADEWLKSVWGH